MSPNTRRNLLDYPREIGDRKLAGTKGEKLADFRWGTPPASPKVGPQLPHPQNLLNSERGTTCDVSAPRPDSKSAAGRFMLVVLAVAAEMERNLTRERTRSAMAIKRSNGHRIGSVPYGYDLADDGSTLKPNESEQAVIADIRALRSRGRKLQQIADALTERGIPTKTGRSDRWSHQAVARIVSRPPIL